MNRASQPSARDDHAIEVIVPVYNNHADVNRLFASLARARSAARFTLTVVDDASPDATPLLLPTVSGPLASVSVISNPHNLGFAGSVNAALAAGRADAVLLNSDTLVFDGWLDRLCRVAASDARVATVTPLSNAATILSYPTFLRDTSGGLETDWATIDRFCAGLASAPVELPTGVGFCMLIRRAALDAVGVLDAAMFGAGYGEECDFCRRAVAKGWINVAATDVFVWHRGEGSFGPRGHDLREQAQRLLQARYPDYRAAVASFIRRDPLRTLRRRLDGLRVAGAPRPTMLLAGPLDDFGPVGDHTAMALRRTGPFWTRGWAPEVEGFGPLPNLPKLGRASSEADLSALLRDTAVREILLPHRRVLPRSLLTRLLAAARRQGIGSRVASQAMATPPSRTDTGRSGRDGGKPQAGR